MNSSLIERYIFEILNKMNIQFRADIEIQKMKLGFRKKEREKTSN